ncbi:MAG: tetratricopeptide repeat protein [Chloroflexi bacterium]|nr:tetratricopeptide repeat protein [Chloroflexota bacterium]
MSAHTPDFDTLWDYTKPAETEQRFRQLLETAAQSPDPAYHLQLLTQIARAQGLQGCYDDAHLTLDSIEDKLHQARLVEIRYLLERGRVFNSSGQPEKAQPLFQQAWELASAEHEDFYAIDAAHMLAIIAPPEEQRVWNLKALALAEASRDVRAQKWRAALYNNLGWSYHEHGFYDKALTMFEKALEWRLAHGQEREIRIARWCVARALRSLQRCEEALTIQHELLAEHQRAGTHDGYIYEEIGECLLLLKRAAEAPPYFARAYDYLSQDGWLAAHETPRLARLKTLATP